MKTLKQNDFKKQLRSKMDQYVHHVYKITKKFPKDEQYGVTSQFRRAALSVILNYIEGFARRKRAVQLNFYETSYGSLKESKYLIKFSFDEGYINETEHAKGLSMADEIGAMLWTEIDSLEFATKYKK